MKKIALLLVLFFALSSVGCDSSRIVEQDTTEVVLPAVSEGIDGEVPSEPEEEPANRTEPIEREVLYLRSTVDGLNVRTGPGTTYAILGSLDKDDMVAYVGETDEWYETVYRNRSAYLSKRYADLVPFSPADEKTESLIALGCRYLGTPYVYGATRLHDGRGNLLRGFSDEQFDCSSLMQFLFFYAKDLLLDVTTRTQVKQGDPVPLSEMKRGDLLFFTNSARKNKPGLERIGHVALYLGDDYLLHTAGDHAVIEPLTAARKQNLLFARRL